MGYDPFSPIAPALINVLCVPAGRIGSADFARYLEWLRANAGVVNLSHTADGNGPDNAQPSGDGGTGLRSSLLFHFSRHGDGDLVQNDAFFEPNRQVQVVLGLVDGATLLSDDSDAAPTVLQDANSKLERFAHQLAARRPSTKIVVFDHLSPLDLDLAVFLQSSENDPNTSGANGWLVSATLSALSAASEEVQPENVILPSLASRFDRLNGADTQRDSQSENARRQSVTSISSRGSTPAQVPNSISEEGNSSPNSGVIVSSAILLLQQGRWAQSLARFAEGARVARNSSQYAWHAKALEGILVSMLLLAWTGQIFQVPQDCYPIGRGFSSSSAVHGIADANRTVSERFAGGTANCLQALTAMLPGLLATIMNLYDKAVTGYGDSFPRFFVCEARVRMSAMLIVVKRHGGSVNAQTLAELIGFGKSTWQTQALEAPGVSLVLRNSSLGHLLIESIIEAQVHLPVQSASIIYLAVCKGLSQLKLERKQGFYLKDVLQRLPPVFMEARRAGSAGVIVPTAASDRQQERVSQGVRALLNVTARTYELPVGSGESHKVTTDDVESHAKERLSSWYNIFASGDIATKLEVLRLCIRVADALPDPVGSIQFMTLLLHIARQTVTLNLRSPNAVPLISSDEQKRLVTGVQSAIASVQRISSTKVSAQYWDDFLVRGITLYEHPSAGKLMPHTSRDLSLTSSTGTSKKDPFIYNPFAGSSSATGLAVLVRDEIASFEVILQNPLEVDLEIESIQLTTDGCDFEADTHNIVLGPLCVQVFTLKGTPRSTGTLKITGCQAQIKNCEEQHFAIFNGHWKPPHFAKKKNALLTDNVQLPASTTLELTIVDPLPSLSINETSPVPRSVMLLDGETHCFDFDLENTSDLEADLVLFSYEDSASRQLMEALSTKDLQPADTYELQYQLTTRPAIRRVPEHDGAKSGRSTSAVAARSRKNFEFTILGKPGLTEVVVLVDYAYIGKPRSEVEGTFYTRQLRFAVNVTVNGSVDIPRCSVLSIPSTARLPAAKTTTRSTNGETDDSQSKPPSESCLLQLDLRSIWQTPLRVTVDTDPSAPTDTASTTKSDPTTSSWTPTTTLTLLPTQITRTLIPITKIYIPNPFAPIPSLAQNNRQFVVSTSKLTLEADLAARESFWYREKLVSTLRIRWEEEYGKRSGEIDVRRGMRLSSRMIDALRVEHVQVTFDLKAVHAAGKDTVRVANRDGQGGGNADFELTRNTFANLIVKVSNYTPSSLKLLLRLQPSLHNQPHNLAMDLSKKFVWSGVLQRVFRSPIPAGQSVQAELGVVGLVEGEYEINGTVEEIRARIGRKNNGGEGGTGGGGDGVAVEVGEKVERRIWHARRACLIRVVDGDAEKE